MKIKLKNTPEQIELVKAMGSKNQAQSREAQEAFAAFLGGVIQVVLQQAGLAPLIYTDVPFNEDDQPSYPLDLYFDADVDYIQVWSQSIAGGLPSNTVEGNKEMKISTYPLDSAVNFLKKYARRSRLDVVSKALTRLAGEVLVKQERNAWAVVIRALAEANTKGTKHVRSATTTNIFQIDDLNKLMTLARRINVSFANGTPDSVYSNGVTDLFISPEIKEQIRGFAYQPMNTRTVDGTAGTPAGSSTALGLPDAIREEAFRNTGNQEIYGVTLHEMLELGDAQKYNALFSQFNTVNSYSFTAATDQIVIGVDTTREACIRAISTEPDTQTTFTAQPDDQFVTRQDKVGFYGHLEEGRCVIDSRALLGVIV